MKKIVCCCFIVLSVLFSSGCLKSDAGDEAGGFRCSDGRIAEKPSDCIEGGTTSMTASTTPETSSSTMPPMFTKTTSTSVSKPTILFPTSTTTNPCVNNILDEGEVIVDCGNLCDCQVLKLSLNGDPQKHQTSEYIFAFNNTVQIKVGECGKGGWPTKASYFHVTCNIKRFAVNITTPVGLMEVMLISPGNSYYLDDLEFGIISMDESESNMLLAVRPNPATKNLAEKAEVFSIGGSRCGTGEGAFCVRTVRGYSLRMLERSVDGVKLEVTTPDGNTLPRIWVQEKPTRIRDIEVGVLNPTALGGYAIMYVS